MMPRILHREVIVCSSCLQASCWQGIFMCENARSAGSKMISVGELRRFGRENAQFWFKDT